MSRLFQLRLRALERSVSTGWVAISGIIVGAVAGAYVAWDSDMPAKWFIGMVVFCSACGSVSLYLADQVAARHKRGRPMPRPQFSLKMLLWLMVLVAIFSVPAGYIYRVRMNRVTVMAPKPVWVGGIVTIYDKPAGGWEVVFLCTSPDRQGASASGVTGADGRFTMSDPSMPAGGLLPGEYAVGFRPATLYHWIGPHEACPASWYPNPKTSGLSVIVKPGSANRFQFDLKPKQNRRRANF